MSDALIILRHRADQAKAAKNPNFPAKYIPKSRYNDRDANGLTTAVVDFLNLSGHFATRLASTGTFRADLQAFVPSKQRSGLPDVMGVVNGKSVFIEIKVGRDRLSQDQKQAIDALQKAGAAVFVASDFQSFYDWFERELAPISTIKSLSL